MGEIPPFVVWSVLLCCWPRQCRAGSTATAITAPQRRVPQKVPKWHFCAVLRGQKKFCPAPGTGPKSGHPVAIVWEAGAPPPKTVDGRRRLKRAVGSSKGQGPYIHFVLAGHRGHLRQHHEGRGGPVGRGRLHKWGFGVRGPEESRKRKT